MSRTDLLIAAFLMSATALALLVGFSATLTRSLGGKVLAFFALFLFPALALGAGFSSHLERAQSTALLSSNIVHICSGARPRAIFAAPTFDDFCITCATVSAPSVCASWIVRLPMVSRPGAVWITVSGFTVPASSAVAAVKGFSVEPGSNRSVTARLRVRLASKRPRLLGL